MLIGLFVQEGMWSQFPQELIGVMWESPCIAVGVDRLMGVTFVMMISDGGLQV